MAYEDKIGQALYYMNIDRYEKSNELLFETLSFSADNGMVLHLIAKNYLYLTDYEEALKFCKNSIEKGYSLDNNFSLMGDIYRFVKNYIKSEESYLESLRLNPRNARVMASYGLLMLQTRHQKKAIQLLEEAISLDPNDEWVLHCWYLYYSADSKLDEQLSTLEKYVVNSQDEKSKLIKIGFYNQNKKNYKEALNKFKEAYLLNPTDEKLLAHLKIIEMMANPFFKPNVLVDKMGGPAVVWIASMVILVTLRAFKLYVLVTCGSILYVFFALYTWIVPKLIEKYYKRKYR